MDRKCQDFENVTRFNKGENYNHLEYKKGQVYFVEMDKVRPCVIMSGQLLNSGSSHVTVVPLSSNIKRIDLPYHGILNTRIQGKYAMFQCEHITTVDKSALRNFVCYVDKSDLYDIERGIFKALDI